MAEILLADVLASVTSDLDPEDGTENRLITPFDEVLRLTWVIDRVESTPYKKVLKQSGMSVTLTEIRPRTPASIKLNEATRLIKNRVEAVVQQTTGLLNNMHTRFQKWTTI